MEEKNQPRRPRRAPEEQTRNESLVYGKNPVTELLKSGSGVDTVVICESAGTQAEDACTMQQMYRAARDLRKIL